MVNQIYKCEKCGMIVENIGGRVKNPKCCGEKMALFEEKTADWKGEKHVPHISIEGDIITVDIGIEMGTPHPMTEEHWIMWIELILKDGNHYKKSLNPGDEPKAVFKVASTDGITAREYCNLHGLWISN